MLWWSRHHPHQTVARIVASYPAALATDVTRVLRIVPVAKVDMHYHQLAPVMVQGEAISLPYRIHFSEPNTGAMLELTQQQRTILATLFTRHHDGFVRERHMRHAIGSSESWVVPFVAHLLGEYVIEIARAIEALGVPNREHYAAFATQNPEFCERTSSRIVSYWNEHHRHTASTFGEYVFYRVAVDLGLWRGRPPRTRRS